VKRGRSIAGGLVLGGLLICFADSPITHALKIVHPGDPKSRDIPVTLTQVNDAEGEPFEFSTWVDSVICRDELCEVVDVQLTWNALGQYQRYRVEKGKDLTKLDHVPFSREDHAKFDRILKDLDSPLREVTKEGLTGPKASGVDGVAGATALTLKANVIIGAGYTCYDLWHWANGGVAAIVTEKSGMSCSVDRLKAYLLREDEVALRFGLTYLHRRKVFDADTMRAVIACSEQAPDGVMDPLLEYLHAASAEPTAYYDALVGVFAKAGSEKRLLILNALEKDPGTPPEGFFDRLSAALPGIETYYELHRFLNLVEARDAVTPGLIEQVVPLLAHEKFFVARRAYAFLSEQTLSDEARKIVEAFYKAHADRL
jgi:hypothetical protein